MLVAQGIESAQMRHDALEEQLVGKPPAEPIDQQRMRTEQFDDAGAAACRRLPVCARHRVAEHDRKAVRDAMDDGAEFGREHEPVAGKRGRTHGNHAGETLKAFRQVEIVVVAAGGDDHAFARRDRLPVAHAHAGHALAVESELARLAAEPDRNAACGQRLDEMADQPEPLATHVAAPALRDDGLVPLRKAIKAAPGRLFLDGDVAGHVVGNEDALAPFAKLVAGDEIGLERAAFGECARRPAKIMVGDAVHEAKANAAAFEERDDRRRAIDEREHALFVKFAAAEKAHVAHDIVAAVVAARGLLQVVLANPDQAVGLRGAAAEQLRFLDQQGLQPGLGCGERRREARHPRAQYDDVVVFCLLAHFFRPAASTIGAQLLVSDFINSTTCCGLMGMGSMISWRRMALTSGNAMVLITF